MHRIEATPSLRAPSPLSRPAGPEEPSRPAAERRSRAALNLRGLCPVCGEAVARRLTVSPAETRETYCCPVDGETVYRVDGGGRKIELPLGAQGDGGAQPRPVVKTTGFRPAYVAMRPAV